VAVLQAPCVSWFACFAFLMAFFAHTQNTLPSWMGINLGSELMASGMQLVPLIKSCMHHLGNCASWQLWLPQILLRNSTICRKQANGTGCRC
jgi:hypothetical protein